MADDPYFSHTANPSAAMPRAGEARASSWPQGNGRLHPHSGPPVRRGGRKEPSSRSPASARGGADTRASPCAPSALCGSRGVPVLLPAVLDSCLFRHPFFLFDLCHSFSLARSLNFTQLARIFHVNRNALPICSFLFSFRVFPLFPLFIHAW
jgi:hypothetical protein